MTQTAYFICPDDDQPSGGIRRIYGFVDVLNDAGRSAYVVHGRPGFRPTWFANTTRSVAAKKVQLDKGDLLVIPEIFGAHIPEIAPGVPHLVLNQGAYMTFTGSALSPEAWRPVVSLTDTIGIVTVSADSEEYLRWSFRDIPVHRLRLGIDPRLFFPPPEGKQRAVAFVPGRNPQELVQLLRILDQRRALEGWRLAPIDKLPEIEAARVLRSSAVFVTVSRQEGFGLPSLEAMACGCVVVGYPGGGGREFLRPDVGYPVEDGAILQCAQTVERVLSLWDAEVAVRELCARAADFVRRQYPPEQEAEDVHRVFGDALDAVAGREPGKRELRFPELTPRWRKAARAVRKRFTTS
jgi:Glycosyl transferases group 1